MDCAPRRSGEPASAWLAIIVPARNEAARLPAGLAALCEKAATLPVTVEIVVVDSHSTDGTSDIVRRWPGGPVPVRLVSCARRGKGRAVRAGLLTTRAPFVGFCDADMATDLSALDHVVSLLRSGETLVLGSRSHPDSQVEDRHSKVRRAGAYVFRAIARMLTSGVRDSQCGFKFFAGDVARAAAARMRVTGFSFDVELIARCQGHGARPVEIPVIWRDVAGSTFSVWRHSLAAFAELGLTWLSLRAPASQGVRPDRAAPPGSRPSATLSGHVIAMVNWRDPWHPDNGGAERYAWEIALGLRRRGATVCFVTARGPGQSRHEIRDGVPITRLGGRWTVYPRVLAWLALRRRAFAAVIDCQNGIPFFSPLVLPRRVGIVCVVHHVHDRQFGVHFAPLVAALGRWLEGPAARWCYRHRECVAVSDSTIRAMRERLAWKGRIHLIPNGLPPDSGHVSGTWPKGDSKDVSLTFVGRLVVHKRAERVLDVAERLARAGVRIDVIGSGPGLPALRIQAAVRGLDDVVRLHGYVPEERKRALVAASVLHLNTSQGEGWGLCVLEAAALGVPTVAYDVDGLRDAVRDGETGWLAGSTELIEDVVERAVKELADPGRRAEVAAACRDWAARFDWDASAGQMAELIRTLAGRPAEAG